MPLARKLNDERVDAENAGEDKWQADAGAVLPLTERQAQVLRCVEQWIGSRGWPPSLSELCAMLGTPSKAVVVEHLKALEKKGYLRRDAGERRGLCVLIASTIAVVLEPRPLRKASLCTRCRREVG